MTYTAHRNTQDTLQILDRVDIDNTERTNDYDLYKKFELEEEYEDNDLTFWQMWRPLIWSMMEEPYSTRLAKVIIIVCLQKNYLFFITLFFLTYIIHFSIFCVKYTDKCYGQ